MHWLIRVKDVNSSMRSRQHGPLESALQWVFARTVMDAGRGTPLLVILRTPDDGDVSLDLEFRRPSRAGLFLARMLSRPQDIRE